MALRHLVLLALLGVAFASVVPRNPRSMIFGRPRHGFMQKALVEHPDPSTLANVPTQHFTNKVDHFDSTNTKTYQQRFWSNNQWYKPGGPAFFMLGGEGPESNGWTINPDLEWTKLAQEHGAWVFLAEHRFYGQSHPTSDMSTANLKFLSSEQALEDFAAFIRGMKVQYPDVANAKWVTFGGSYSGALAAWMRLKYPDLVFAAVGSSGPVQAEVDFVEYMEVVENSITNTSASCGASVTAGFNQVAQLLQTASGRQSLKTTFNLCEALDTTNALQIQTFWSTIYGPYMEIVQYSGDNAGKFRNQLNIQNAICRFHNQAGSSTMAKMQAVNQYYNQQNGYSGCNDINYDDFIKAMHGTSFLSPYASSRAWVWQTCTEFGYYQSTDSKTAGPWFGSIGSVPVSYYTQQCTDIYGSAYTASSINSAISKTNSFYGGRDNFNTTQVVLPNGFIDPWHALGKVASNQQSVVPVLIAGSAHCGDMYAAASDDSQAIKDARATIASTLAGWLAQ